MHRRNFIISAVIMSGAQWRRGRAFDLRSLGLGFNSGTKLRNNLGKVVHTYVPLSPSGITWYWSKDGDVLWLRR